MSSTYKPNGNVIPIDKTAAILYVFLLLSEFDRDMEKNKIPDLNPYEDKIIMPTEDGKFVIIPNELQMYAVKHWIAGTKPKEISNKNISSKEKNEDEDIEKDEEHDEDCICKKCESKVNISSSISNLLICVLLIVAIFYFLGCMRSNLV